MKLAIMRTKDKAEESVAMAREMGFEVMFASPLELEELDTPAFWRFVEELEAGRVGRVMVTSSTAVKYMFKLLEKRGKATSVFTLLNRRGVIAIGPVTADAAKAKWLKVEAVPEKFTSDGLVRLLEGKVSKDETVWVIRSDQGSDVIRKGLEAMGAKVEEVPVYALRRSEPDRALLDMYYFTVHGGIDAFAFTSSMSAKAFIEEGERKYGVREFGTSLNAAIIGAIGEPTKRTLESMGIDVDVMPKDATFEGLLKALMDHIRQRE
ncbi:MAG: uroporphyrinogen-III synthase [Methanomassiliicoccales archaeon]|nr:MAG: uroporphyrinogen-III synthase [Methanomassiliicoccales archaeon]